MFFLAASKHIKPLSSRALKSDEPEAAVGSPKSVTFTKAFDSCVKKLRAEKTTYYKDYGTIDYSNKCLHIPKTIPMIDYNHKCLQFGKDYNQVY